MFSPSYPILDIFLKYIIQYSLYKTLLNSLDSVPTMDPLLKDGLQRKFSIIGLILILLLFAGLTYYIISLFLVPPSVEVEEPLDTEETTLPIRETGDEEPLQAILPSPKEELLYVISKTAKEVTVIDTVTDERISRVGLPEEADFAYYNKEDNRLYVSHSEDYLISVVNINNPTVRKIELNEKPGDLVVANGLIYVVMPEIDEIYVIDPLTEIIEKEIESGKQPQRLTMSKDKSRIFVTNRRSETVDIISTSINAKVDFIKINTQIVGVALDPSERYIYVTNDFDSSITVVPLRVQKRLRTIGVGSNPSSVVFSPTNLVAIATNEGDNTVAIISVSQEQVIDYIEVGLSPADVIITSDGKKAYVANSHDGHISVIDVEQKIKLKDIAVGNAPVALLLVEK